MPSRRLFCILALCCVVILVTCSEPDVHVPQETVLGGPSFALDPNPLGNRPNPLQTYIQANWTNGDPDATGGTHYSHIKTYGHNYTNFAWLSDGQAQAQFVVDHFDMYVWGGAIVGQTIQGSQYDDMLWIVQCATAEAFWGWENTYVVEEWLNSPQNENGYTKDDLILHYMYDNPDRPLGPVLGWNPEDDPNGDGCLEGNHRDPNRTAECFWDARAEWQGNGNTYFGRDPLSGANQEQTADNALNQWNQYHPGGYHIDVLAYESGTGIVLDLGNTFRYAGQDPTDPNFQYIADKLYYAPASMALYEQMRGGVPTIMIGNMVSPLYTCRREAGKTAGLEYLENVLNETWMVTGSGNPWDTSRREDYLSCPFLTWMNQDKGYVFTCLDYAGNETNKLFSLAMFYMINHPMAFYYYRTHDHSTQEGEYVADWQWNPWVEYDIGQPAVNSLLIADFKGNYGTTNYFVLETTPNHEILGREYEQSDGTRVLVLVKLLTTGAPGQNPSVVNLPGEYQRLTAPGGGLSGVINAVTLTNNEGVILVEYTGSGGGGGGGKYEPNEPVAQPDQSAR